MKPLKICIDARLPDATIGGSAKVVIGLAKAFAKLDDGPEEYHFYTFSDANDWILPFIKGQCRALPGPPFGSGSFRRRLADNPRIRRLWHQLSLSLLPYTFRLPQSDGTVERHGFDVMHFTQQHAFLTDIPSVYQPHDLQHLHLPECFSRRERFVRSIVYPTFCKRASMVIAMSRWGKADLLRHFQLADESVQIIPWGPLTDETTPSPSDVRQVREAFQLPEKFLIYPAQTWPHKNHIGLVEAIKTVRDQFHLDVHVVCSGRTNDFFPQIRKRMTQLGVADLFHFVGFVSEHDLQCLYRAARGLVFPTRFEGWGLPITEAFLAGLPVASSNATCLPDQVGDAAITFNPNDPVEIACQIVKLWTDDSLRRELSNKGTNRASHFSWDYTARLLRAHYRRIAKRKLSAQDQTLLVAPPLV